MIAAEEFEFVYSVFVAAAAEEFEGIGVEDFAVVEDLVQVESTLY